jgi:uncharacterized protein YbjT (DUF2867 family)
MTFADAVADIGRATGRPMVYEQIPLDGYKAMLAGYGVPADFVWLVGYLFTEVLDGRNASLADGVERALGRPARDFADYARAAAAAGAWS